MESEGSLHCSQQLDFGPYPTPDKLMLLWRSFLILSFLPSWRISSSRSLFLKFCSRYPVHIPVANARWVSLCQDEENRWCRAYIWLSPVHKYGLCCTDLADLLGMYGGGDILELKLGLYKIIIHDVYTRLWRDFVDEFLLLHFSLLQRFSGVAEGLINYFWNKNCSVRNYGLFLKWRHTTIDSRSKLTLIFKFIGWTT
jgi:hypothetical protein